MWSRKQFRELLWTSTEPDVLGVDSRVDHRWGEDEEGDTTAVWNKKMDGDGREGQSCEEPWVLHVRPTFGEDGPFLKPSLSYCKGEEGEYQAGTNRGWWVRTERNQVREETTCLTSPTTPEAKAEQRRFVAFRQRKGAGRKFKLKRFVFKQQQEEEKPQK